MRLDSVFCGCSRTRASPELSFCSLPVTRDVSTPDSLWTYRSGVSCIYLQGHQKHGGYLSGIGCLFIRNLDWFGLVGANPIHWSFDACLCTHY